MRRLYLLEKIEVFNKRVNPATNHKRSYTMAKLTLAEVSKQMEAMAALLTDLKAQNEALEKSLAEAKKKAKALPEVKVKGHVKDGSLFIKMPVADVFQLTLKDGTSIDYLFTTGNRSVDLEGIDGYKVKVSVFKSPKKA